MKLRESNLNKLDGGRFDVLVVGGGINGAVSAAALSAQGVRVALIDRGDFAGLTSQESSNLVWGGIKYLESGDVVLVRKLCSSRNRLIKTYPSSVKEIRFFVSVEPGFRRARGTLFLGACAYWAMGDFFTAGPRLLSADDIAQEEPVVSAPGGSGGIEYSDAYLVDNDARFTFGFVRSAMDYGAIVANYVQSLGVQRDEQGGYKVAACDVVSGRALEVSASVLINACGPLVDAHNALHGLSTTHQHVLSKGVHLIVDRVTPSRRVLTFFADDGRMFFVVPLGNKSCLGTTDTRVLDLPAVVTSEDRRFILDNVNKRLKLRAPLTEADIIAERCGVRPLVVRRDGGTVDGGDWTALSRKHAVELDVEARHVSVFGGKLTDCLNVGQEVTDAVERLGVPLPFRGARWYGEPPDEIRDEFFHQARLMHLDAMTAKESSEQLSTRLWRRYGGSALALLDDIRQDPGMGEVLIRGTEYIRAELHHAAGREMVTKLEDFLRRRSKIALIGRKRDIVKAPGLLEACQILFGDEASAKFDEYFADVARRESLRPPTGGASGAAGAPGAAAE